MDIIKTDLFNNVYIKSWTWGRLSETEKLSFIEVINKLLCCHKITKHSKHFEAVVDIAYMSFLYGLGYKCGFVDWRKSYDE